MLFSSFTFAVGSIAFVLIGILHTYVHFAWLAGDELFQRMNALGTTPLGEMDAPIWGLFQGTSILMGFFSLAFGSVLLAHLAGRNRNPMVHAALCSIAIVLLIGIVVVGHLHLSALQVYGGAFGIVCFGIPLVSVLRGKGRS